MCELRGAFALLFTDSFRLAMQCLFKFQLMHCHTLLVGKSRKQKIRSRLPCKVEAGRGRGRQSCQPKETGAAAEEVDQ